MQLLLILFFLFYDFSQSLTFFKHIFFWSYMLSSIKDMKTLLFRMPVVLKNM